MGPITDEWEEKMQYPYRKEYHSILHKNASLVAQAVKHLPAMRETGVQSLGWEDSPGEGNGNSLQYSCLENPMDGGAW